MSCALQDVVEWCPQPPCPTPDTKNVPDIGSCPQGSGPSLRPTNLESDVWVGQLVPEAGRASSGQGLGEGGELEPGWGWPLPSVNLPPPLQSKSGQSPALLRV